MSNTELADRVGLSPSPCLRRVRHLEDTGVILGYHARIAPAAIGRAFEVNVEIDLALTDRATVERFEATLAGYDEVIEVRRMFGIPDYLVLVAVADQAAYEEFLTQKLIDLPGLAKLASHFTMKILKSDIPLAT